MPKKKARSATPALSGSSLPRIAILGFGTMGPALLRGILRRGVTIPDNVTVTARDAEKLAKKLAQEPLFLGVRGTTDNADAVARADIVILAFKPQSFHDVALHLRGCIGTGHLVLSLLAGKTTDEIMATLEGERIRGGEGTSRGDRAPARKGGIPVIRAMPNIAAEVMAACSPFSRGAFATAEHAALATEIFGSVGETMEVHEDHMDAVTGLSGSGPAYVFMMIEALKDGGLAVGLPRDIAYRLSVQTLYGGAKLAKERPDKHPAQLRDEVTTPGGSTIHGTIELERNGLRVALASAIITATNRSRELGQRR